MRRRTPITRNTQIAINSKETKLILPVINIVRCAPIPTRTNQRETDNTIWNKEKTHAPPVLVTRHKANRDGALNFEPRTYFMINSKTKSAECVPVSDWYCLNLIYFSACNADFAPNEYAFPNGRAVFETRSNTRSIFEFESIGRIAWERWFLPFCRLIRQPVLEVLPIPWQFCTLMLITVKVIFDYTQTLKVRRAVKVFCDGIA